MKAAVSSKSSPATHVYLQFDKKHRFLYFNAQHFPISYFSKLTI
jgi:hypothetical protein